MKIIVQYETQARRAAGVGSETVEVSEGATVAQVVRQLAASHGDPLRAILLDDAAEIQPTLLLFVSDEQIDRDGSTALSDGDSLTIMTPISGG